MKILDLRLHHLQIPFTGSFDHASAARRKGDSLFLSLDFDNGIRGYGEGCPRPYVTGETIASATAFIHLIKEDALAKIGDLHSLRAWVNDHEKLIDQNPAAWCAFELAVIDAFSRQAAVCPSEMLGRPRDANFPFLYTAVIGGGNLNQLNHYLQTYTKLGFSDFKLKLTGSANLDRERIKQLRKCHLKARLRLDANNLWSTPDEAKAYLAKLPGAFFAIEEPLQARDHTGLKLLADRIPQRIILDESLRTTQDFEFLRSHKDRFIANFRVSKLGGLLRSKKLVDAAEKEGIDYILGAQVGETSILTRAAMMLGPHHSPHLLGREGAAGEYLLTKDISTPSVAFGKGGKCLLPKASPGLAGDVVLPTVSP